jgi:HPt (histidine-containing phosphotransfer) domain-containing protein
LGIFIANRLQMDTATPGMKLATPRVSAEVRSVPDEPIDHAHLRRFTLGNAALEHEVLSLFAHQSPTYLLHLMAAETDRAWFEAAHALKGSARAVGAWQIAKLAERAEAVRSTHDPEARADAVDALSAALAEARHYIASLSAGM